MVVKRPFGSEPVRSYAGISFVSQGGYRGDDHPAAAADDDDHNEMNETSASQDGDKFVDIKVIVQGGQNVKKLTSPTHTRY